MPLDRDRNCGVLGSNQRLAVLRLTRFAVKVFLLFFAWFGIGITFGVWLAVLKTSVDGGPWLWPVAYIGCVFLVLAIIAEIIPDMDNN